MTATRKVLVGMAVCAFALAGMTAAWACSPGGDIAVNPGSGLPASPVQVNGTGFLAPSAEAGPKQAGPVEIRWNTTNGRLLATANDVSFSTSVTVPENAAAKRYYFVAVQRRADGGIVRQASAPFLVTAPATRSGPPPPANTEPPADNGEAAAPASGEAGSTEPKAEPEPEPATAQAADPTTAARRPAARSAATAAGVARSARSGDAVAAGPPTDPGQPAEPAPGPQPPPTAPEVAPGVSPRSVSGDVWGAWTSSHAATRGPSLTVPTPAMQPTSVALGIALLALGSATLMGGAFLGLRSRRRAVNTQSL